MQRKVLNKAKLWQILGYKPSPEQLAVHSSTARFRVNVQGRRSGKSYSAAKEVLPYLLVPNNRCWVVAPTLDLANKIVREIQLDVVRNLKLPIAFKKEVSGSLHYMKLAGLNSELSAKSADRPETLVGDGVDVLIVEEAAKIRRIVWEQYLRPTLADKQGWALFTTTPEGYNWIYELWQRGKSEDFPDWDSWQHPSWQSPYFKDDIDELKKTLTRETFEQEFGAQFTSFSGRVFPYDRTIHTKKLKYNPNLPTYVGIDFGYRTSAAGWFQVDQSHDKDKVYMIDEVWEENIKTEDFADKVRSKNYPVVRFFGDPAGGGVQAQSGIGDIEIFKKKGIRVDFRRDKVSRNIANGITHMRTWFEDASGNAHFYVDKRCERFISSFENYRYPEKKKDQRLKEEPLKDGLNDHACDATRYFFVNLFPIRSRTAGVIDW